MHILLAGSNALLQAYNVNMATSLVQPCLGLHPFSRLIHAEPMHVCMCTPMNVCMCTPMLAGAAGGAL